MNKVFFTFVSIMSSVGALVFSEAHAAPDGANITAVRCSTEQVWCPDAIGYPTPFGKIITDNP